MAVRHVDMAAGTYVLARGVCKGGACQEIVALLAKQHMAAKHKYSAQQQKTLLDVASWLIDMAVIFCKTAVFYMLVTTWYGGGDSEAVTMGIETVVVCVMQQLARAHTTMLNRACFMQRKSNVKTATRQASCVHHS